MTAYQIFAPSYLLHDSTDSFGNYVHTWTIRQHALPEVTNQNMILSPLFTYVSACVYVCKWSISELVKVLSALNPKCHLESRCSGTLNWSKLQIFKKWYIIKKILNTIKICFKKKDGNLFSPLTQFIRGLCNMKIYSSTNYIKFKLNLHIHDIQYTHPR